MLKAFVDESEKTDRFYFLTGLVCSEKQSGTIQEGLEAVLEKHSETYAGIEQNEFHAHEMMAGKHEWRKVPLRLRFAIYDQALRCIRDSGASVYIEGINVRAHAARYKDPAPVRELALSHLLERINECAEAHHADVDVVADNHHSAETSKSNFTRYQQWGTYGYKSSQLTRINEFEFLDSRTHRCLQAADLITYLYNRHMTHTETDRRAAATKRSMWNTIAPAARYPRGRARIWP